jgi:hypothetical protein
MREYEESPLRMMDDPHELDDPTEADYDVDEWYPRMAAMIEIESLSLVLCLGLK